ncbi:hypothetical protein GQ457_03G019690 [Hibiscus cannabinus]
MRSNDSKSEKNQNQEGRVNSTSNIMNKKRRQIEWVIDNDKMEILNVCAIGFYRRPYKVVELANKFRLAGLQGFRVMRIAGSLMLLMFDDDTMRQNVLASGKLDEWLENVGLLNSRMPIPNRRTWLSISGLSIQVCSEKTFGNIASLWGELVQINVETLVLSSFERARFQIKTDWRFHIDEDLEVRVGEYCFLIRVTEIEEAIGPKCDCSCELVEESEWSGKQDGKEDEKERIVVSAMKGGDGENYSKETVMPNSISLTAMNTLEMDKMWEDNKVVDWCAMETASWMADENIGMVQRDEEVHDSDVSAECGLRDELLVRAKKDVDLISPICNGPSNRVNLTEVIEYRGQQRKVRKISDVLLSEVPSPEQAVAPNQIFKKRRGHPKLKNTEDKRIVNGSLSDSDFFNPRIIETWEPRKKWFLMKLLSWNVKGLRSAAKRRSVQLLLRQQRCGMVMLQETKLEHIDERDIVDYFTT